LFFSLFYNDVTSEITIQTKLYLPFYELETDRYIGLPILSADTFKRFASLKFRGKKCR